MTQQRLYAEAGVDLAARAQFASGLSSVLARARRPEVLTDAGAFSGLFHIGERYRDPVIAASADGIGTKVKLQLAANRLDLAGFDIVGHCVDDILCSGAEPVFFLDYIAGNGLTNEQKSALVEGVASACAETGCALLGGETADMPDVYAPGDFDLAGFMVGVVERDEIIDGSSIEPGNVLLGIASSGLHTNGYSLVRRALDVANGEDAEETRRRLAERPPELGGQSLGDALLATHRPYYALVAPALGRIRGIAHITGGGWPENLRRILPEGVTAAVDLQSWDVPPLFSLIQRRGEVTREEMYEVFNMGMGLVLVVAREDEEAVRERVPGAVPIGQVVPSVGVPVELRGL